MTIIHNFRSCKACEVTHSIGTAITELNKSAASAEIDDRGEEKFTILLICSCEKQINCPRCGKLFK